MLEAAEHYKTAMNYLKVRYVYINFISERKVSYCSYNLEYRYPEKGSFRLQTP